MKRILAAVARGAKDPLTVENVFLSQPKTNEVLVRLVSTGICHTDIHTKGHGFCSFPSVLGHEGTGIIEQLGTEGSSRGLKVGDHVVMSYASCGSCTSCDQAKPSYCLSHGELNFSCTRADGTTTIEGDSGEQVHGSFFQQSSFATHALATTSNVIKVEHDVPLAPLAPLGCGAQTGAGAILNSFNVKNGSDVLVVGCGAVGLSSVMASAHIASAKRVIAVDTNESRTKLAMDVGATDVLHLQRDTTSEEFVQFVMDATSGRGVQYAVDTSGRPDAMANASKCLSPMGIIGMVAPGGPGATVSLECLTMLAGKSFRGIVQGDSVAHTFIPELIGHWQAGRFPFEKYITEYHSLDSINQAIQDMGTGTTIKPVVHISAV